MSEIEITQIEFGSWKIRYNDALGVRHIKYFDSLLHVSRFAHKVYIA